MGYEEFLASKRQVVQASGFEVGPDEINPMLFPHERDLVLYALRKGRAGLFADTGLGKTFMQIEWARLIGGRVLIIAPLSVTKQTVREGQKLGVEIYYTRSGDDLRDGINITNYEMIEHFNAGDFNAVVLDESSILKSLNGSTRRKLTEMFAETAYRLCCTATPAPNDHVELGNHAEFLGICSEAEMRAMFFINANKEHTFTLDDKTYTKKGSNKNGTEWRLKHNAEVPFYQWLSSWAISLSRPSDLGYSDDGYILPELTINPHYCEAQGSPDGQLFFTHLKGIQDRAKVRRQTLGVRLDKLRELIENDTDQWVIWCGLDAEHRAVEEMLGDSCISIYGSLSPEEKEERLELWLSGDSRFLVSKPRVCGFGLNLQQAHRMAFLGLNDSWESWYQCIRREYRFRQEHPVTVDVIISDYEAEIYENIMRKDAMATRLRRGLIEHIRGYEMDELAMGKETIEQAENQTVHGKNWTAMRGDSCERLKEINASSVDLSVYSPPFADLFTYTNSYRDLGNSRDWGEFFAHYRFVIRAVLRLTKPGRLSCVHTADIPAMLERDGYIGIRDFPGEVIRCHEAEGWIYHGRTTIDKNPQAQALRTHAKNLLFAQLEKDSSWSRSAIADYILVFRKPGQNVVPIQPVANGGISRKDWILWARPIWYAADYAPGSFANTGRDDFKSGEPCSNGIRETDTLQVAAGRGAEDEKHICPLQLGTIERCIKLYSNPGEIVLDPFNGIGSTGYVAINNGRRYVGIELKESYFRVAVKNLQRAETQSTAVTLFDFAASAEGLPEGRAS